MELQTKRIIRFLIVFTAFLSVLHIGQLIIYYWVGDPNEFDFIELFDFDYEENLPTTFSSMLFFINSLLLFFIWRHGQINHLRYGRQWLGLAVLFLYLGFDESAKIHENLGDIVENYVDASGFLYFPWFIAYLSIFIVLVILYIPFYLRQPRQVMIGFLIAGVLFITGAVGFDILGAKEAYDHGTESMTYSVLYTIEELLEMSGLIVFANTLLNILGNRKFTLEVAI